MAKGQVQQVGAVVQLATRIPAELAKRLRIVAAQHDKLVGEIVREAIEPVVVKLEKEAR